MGSTMSAERHCQHNFEAYLRHLILQLSREYGTRIITGDMRSLKHAHACKYKGRWHAVKGL